MAGVSLRSIAKELGYSPGSIYQHFESKDAMLIVLAQEATSRMRERLSNAPMDAPNNHPLVAMGMAFIQTCREYPDDMTVAGILRTRTSLDEPVPPHSPYSLILSQIESAASCGELPAQSRHSMESVAYGIWALVEGIVSLQRTHLRAFDADFEEADRRALVALINGYTNEEITP